MNALYKFYCRCYQKVMYVAECFLPWRVPEQISGEGSLKKLPKFAKNKGFKSALVVTDEVLMKLGMADPIIEGFKAEGLGVVVFDKVVPNPTITNIEDGLKMYKENNCDVIIALGGGSAMDCAKGIGARVARPNKPISKMKGVLKVMKNFLRWSQSPPLPVRAAKQLSRRLSPTPKPTRNTPSTTPFSFLTMRLWTLCLP